jgi:hypothetical protein
MWHPTAVGGCRTFAHPIKFEELEHLQTCANVAGPRLASDLVGSSFERLYNFM